MNGGFLEWIYKDAVTVLLSCKSDEDNSNSLVPTLIPALRKRAI